MFNKKIEELQTNEKNDYRYAVARNFFRQLKEHNIFEKLFSNEINNNFNIEKFSAYGASTSKYQFIMYVVNSLINENIERHNLLKYEELEKFGEKVFTATYFELFGKDKEYEEQEILSSKMIQTLHVGVQQNNNFFNIGDIALEDGFTNRLLYRENYQAF